MFHPIPTKNVPHLSVAVWPDTIQVGNIEGKNDSSDTHDSRESAEAVCRGLEREGFGGQGKVFPLSTRVEPLEIASHVCETCGIGYRLPSGRCDHCNRPF